MALAPTVLVVAGSDSSGGAGVARDLSTLFRHGVRAALAVTAVTAQTHAAVRAVETMPAALVVEQMLAALAASPVGAVKIGMLGSGQTAMAVAGVLGDHPACPAILDPVLSASSGGSLLAGDARTALDGLMARAALVTPNRPELARLCGEPEATSQDEAIAQAVRLLERGARAVLVKGGHAGGARSDDLLVMPGAAVQRFSSPRLPFTLRGTGCTLASAIAAQLALGAGLSEAIALAKQHVSERLAEEGLPSDR